MLEMKKYPCGICEKSVKSNHKAVQCDICNLWSHTKCNNISRNEYSLLETSDKKWACVKCMNGALPFADQSAPLT